MFAVQHWDVEPDIVVMAKGIARACLSGSAQDLLTACRRVHGGTTRRQRGLVRGRQHHLGVIEDEGLVANAGRGPQP
jgi:4-aminobutyrate aminotransferase-like enzyme